METALAEKTALAETTESASVTTEETKVEAVSAESASVTEETKVETTDTTETIEKAGAKPKVVDDLIKQRKLRQKAEKEAAYWRGVAEGAKGGVKPVETEKPPELVEPKLEDSLTKFPDDYAQAEQHYRNSLRAYDREVIKREVASELGQRDQAATTEAHEKKVKEDFEAMIEAEAESNPDFPEIVQNMGNRLVGAEPVARAIMESEMSAALILYFHNNPKVEKELAKLCMISPLSAARRLGAIEFELKNKPKPEVKKVTTAPAPIKTVESTASAALVDLDDLPVDKYIEAKNARERERRRK